MKQKQVLKFSWLLWPWVQLSGYHKRVSENLLWVKCGRLAFEADNLTVICEPTAWNSGLQTEKNEDILWCTQVHIMNYVKLNIIHLYMYIRPPLPSNGQSSSLQIQRFRVRFQALLIFLRSRGSETSSAQPREVNWGAAWMKNSSSGLDIEINGSWDPLRWPRNSMSAKVSTSFRDAALECRHAAIRCTEQPVQLHSHISHIAQTLCNTHNKVQVQL
jgi:hypothetical protein